jgi:hypothetical protein
MSNSWTKGKMERPRGGTFLIDSLFEYILENLVVTDLCSVFASNLPKNTPKISITMI